MLAGSGPVSVSVDGATTVLERLPGHLGDPAAAWPRSVRGELPAPGLLIAALVVAGLVALGVLCGVVYLVLRLQRMRQPENSAQWATSKCSPPEVRSG